LNQQADKLPPIEPLEIYNNDGSLKASFLSEITSAIDAGRSGYLAVEIDQLHESELGDLLEALDGERRNRLVALSGDGFDFASLTEVDEAVRLEITDAMPNERIAEAFRELDSDDAVFILEDMETSDQEEILARMPVQERVGLQRALDYPEDTAGRRMQTEFIAVPPFWSVGQTIDHLREAKDLPDRFSEIFAIEPTYKLAGTVELDQLLRTGRDIKIEAILDDNLHAIPATMDQEEAAMVFERYDLLSAAVIDENERLVGVLTIDDVVDVIQEEAEEDIKLLADVGDEELSDKVFETARSRFTWLLANLVTAIAASFIISLFDATIEQMVALAVLMPIVASMGGNAGTQTMTVAVRALATRDIDTYNAKRIIRRESMVGLINGVVFALLMGVIATLWFSNGQLGLIIGIAMVINMLFAALAGILIPLTLHKMKIDPAIASSVFVTTVTDVVGFFAFLGLASLWIAS
jgi:magnesium transporter